MTTTPFTIHNLPYGIISTKDNPKPRQAIAYQHYAIEVGRLETNGVFEKIPDLEHGALSKVSRLPPTNPH